MGITTNGEISLGILFEQYYPFPWNDYGDINEWWLQENGYTPPFELFDDDGNYINGVRPPEEKIDRYFNHKREFAKQRPLPVELVNVCSNEYPIYILAVPGSVTTASRGYPVHLDSTRAKVMQELQEQDEKVKALIDFCEKYCRSTVDYIDTPAFEPRWYLSSYYG